MAFDYEYFKKEILKITGINLTAYKEVQMKRRIDALITKYGVSGYNNFVERLKSDKVLLNEFVEYITINVSEFYRNPEQWEYLSKEVLPKFARIKGDKIKIWSAACSTGDEPYSLVMALSEFIPLNKIKIYATDISDEIMDKAKIGIYNSKSIENVPDKFKNKYFAKNGVFYSISDEIKNCVEFKKHDLLKEGYHTNCDIIVCRNVLIYFTEEAKDEIYRKFYNSLNPGGILFIGSTEQIINYKNIGYKKAGNFFYEK